MTFRANAAEGCPHALLEEHADPVWWELPGGALSGVRVWNRRRPSGCQRMHLEG